MKGRYTCFFLTLLSYLVLKKLFKESSREKEKESEMEHYKLFPGGTWYNSQLHRRKEEEEEGREEKFFLLLSSS